MNDQLRKKKKNDKHYGRWLLLIAVSVAVTGLIILGGFYLVQKLPETFSDRSRDMSGEEARASIEDALKISLPDSVSNMRFVYTSWLDFDMRMKFDIAPDDVPAFLDSLSEMCFAQALQEVIKPFVTIQTDWWQPNQASDVIGAEQCGNNPFWSLMIDRDNSSAWTVYIEAFST